MRCVAVPDEYTVCQDFGGVDHVADALDDSVAEAVLSLAEVA